MLSTKDVDDARWPGTIHHHFLPVMNPNSVYSPLPIKDHGARSSAHLATEFPANLARCNAIPLPAVLGLSGEFHF